jgi:hypothetical protein
MIALFRILRWTGVAGAVLLFLMAIAVAAEWRRSLLVEDTLLWSSWSGDNRLSSERHVVLIFAQGHVTLDTTTRWWRDYQEEEWLVWGPRGDPGLRFNIQSEPLAHARRVLGNSKWNRRGFGNSSGHEQRAGGHGGMTGSQSRFATAPAWLVLGALLLWPTTLVALPLSRTWIGTLRRRARRRAGKCERCGYDVWATPQRCPECGWAVKPPRRANDRTTAERRRSDGSGA